MMNKPSRFEDQAYMKTTLRIVAGLCFIGTGLLGINTVSVGYMPTAIGLFAGSIFSAVMLVLTLRENMFLPRLLIPPVAFSIIVFLVLVGEGVRDEGILGFVLVIVLSGLLLGRNWSAIYTLAGITAITIIGIGQLNGWFPRLTGMALRSFRIIVIDILFLFIGAVVYITIGNLERMLIKLQQREAELRESNQTLTAIQSGLEERISERVRSLNEAREEAETARKEIEHQAWLATGLAELNDVLRGEQEINELASKVIQHLCIYTGALVGALFLRDENDCYQQTGLYACAEIAQPCFKPGEGLVGQAAQNRAPFLLADIPEDTIRITTGLTDISPTTIIAIPFFYDEQIIGVYEIGALTPFTDQQRQFLESAVESIGIAFHTTQARAQIDQLLQQTQQQAAELQERQEELRATNEELEAQAENLRIANLELQAQTERLQTLEQQE